MTQHDRRFSRGQESRMSIESLMTFDGLQKEKFFDGADLLDAFHNSNIGYNNNDASMQFVNAAATKRPSAKMFAGTERVCFGKDLMSIFKQDQDTSMGMSSFHSIRRRSSTMSRGTAGNDTRRGSLMSMTDCSIVENPLELEDILDAVGAVPMPVMNNSSEQRTPLPAMNNPSEQRIEENTINNNTINSNQASDTNQEGDEHIQYIRQNNEMVECIHKIGPYDIICGRNNGAHDWVGNRRFRITIMMHLKKYTEAPTREEKTHVIKSVIELMLEGVGGRFIKKVGDNMYVRLKDKQIREKVGHAFRDMIILAEQEGEKLTDKCFR